RGPCVPVRQAVGLVELAAQGIHRHLGVKVQRTHLGADRPDSRAWRRDDRPSRWRRAAQSRLPLPFEHDLPLPRAAARPCILAPGFVGRLSGALSLVGLSPLSLVRVSARLEGFCLGGFECCLTHVLTPCAVCWWCLSSRVLTSPSRLGSSAGRSDSLARAGCTNSSNNCGSGLVQPTEPYPRHDTQSERSPQHSQAP